MWSGFAMNRNMIFIKLGGSLITNKDMPRSPRMDIIHDLALEVHSIKKILPDAKIILGHGSGSFGHTSAKEFKTRQGVVTNAEWLGFAEVWWQAASLNHIVVNALHQVDLPAITFPVSSSVITRDGQLISWSLKPVKEALAKNLLPVFYGDVVFDSIRGGTILSTEDIFSHLAVSLHPDKILLVGIEKGVWLDYPKRTQLIPEITQNNFNQVFPHLSGSEETDVTGGMISKVQAMLALVEKIPHLNVQIFSGTPSENLTKVLMGKSLGTKIHSKIK